MLARDRAIIGFTSGTVFLVAAWEFAVIPQTFDPFSVGSSLGLAGLGVALFAITFYSLTQNGDEFPDRAEDIAAHEVTVAVYDMMGTPLDSEEDMSPELLKVISKILGERKPNTLAALERRSIYRQNLKRRENQIPTVIGSHLRNPD